MIGYLLTLVYYISRGFSLLLIAYVVLSYFMDPYHPVRSTVDRIVNPVLNPIRRVLPQSGRMDFSPIVAIILVWFLETILRSLLFSLGS